MVAGVIHEENASTVKKSSHRITTTRSVQAVVVDEDVLFAGLQGGLISAYSLDTYELLSSVHAHEESVLGLTLSDDHDLLFSTGADSVVKVWSSQSLEPLYSLYSSHDIGDVFCVAHSSRTETAFFGAQNGSISWQHCRPDDLTSPRVLFSPSSRKHRFFDSRGPGGTLTPLQLRDTDGQPVSSAGRKVTIKNDQYKSYAHNGYIYAMLLTKGLFRHDSEEEVLITGGGGGDIKLWKITDLAQSGLTPLYRLKNKASSVLTLACSGSFLYAGLTDGAAHVYNLSSCQLIQRLSIGSADVNQIKVSRGTFCCGTADGYIKVGVPVL